MGLFDLADNQGDREPKKIRGFTGSIVKRTDNVPAALKEIAQNHGVRIDEVDFVLHGTLSEIKLPGNEEWEELTSAHFGRINDDNFLLEPELYFRQIHHLTFRPKPKEGDLRLDIDLRADKARSRAGALIKASSKIRNYSNIKEFIESELNKVKLRHGMLVGLREGGMKTDITQMINKIRVHDKLTEDMTIRLSQWIAPIYPIDDRLILHYKQNAELKKELMAEEKAREQTNKPDRIDYAERGFINAVEEGELLIEYVKPIEGRAGRDFRGNHISVREAKLQYGPVDFPDSETIQTEENDEAILYYAKHQGYVAYDGVSHLCVGETLELDTLDFKHTGNINAGLDKDIKIAVRGKDVSEDHIGPKTKVEATEIELSGSVANGAIVHAVRVTIEGQTHGTSQIIATEWAKIAVHKGQLKTIRADIDKLEHGRINADEVVVNRVMGGTISARRITIGTLHSHATLIASEQILIKQLVGGENRIYIEAAAAQSDKETLRGLIEETRELSKKRDEIKRKYLNKSSLIKRNKTQAEDLKARIDKDRKAGRTPPSAFVDRYRQFLEELKNTSYLHKQLDEITAQLGAKQDQLTLKQDGVLNAVIINQDIWRNYNEIRFRTINPPKEILYVPPENSKLTQIRLETIGNDEYAIRALD